jgi:hypothetical protein
MDNLNSFSMLSTLVTLLPDAAVLGLCIYYFSQKKTLDGLLLSIGSGFGFLLGAFFRVLPIINSEAYMEFTQMNIFMITSAIGFISSACFAVGFGILIMNTLNQVKNS